MSTKKRLAVIFDAVEERWPSMEYAAEMLLRTLQVEHSERFTSVPIRPRFFRGFESARRLGSRNAWNANRGIGGDVAMDYQFHGRIAVFGDMHGY